MLSNENIAALRFKFRDFCIPSILTPNDSIALVGAFFDSQSETGLYAPDEFLFGEALKALYDRGIFVSDKFTPHIVNINEDHGGIDYADPANKQEYKISIFCYIKRIMRARDGTSNKANSYLKNSPFELKNYNAWRDGAVNHGSKTLVTHGRVGEEVTARDFTKTWRRWASPYKCIHSTPLVHRPDTPLRLTDSVLQIMTHS